MHYHILLYPKTKENKNDKLWIKLNHKIYSYFEKDCPKKKMLATIPMGYDQYTFPDTVTVESTSAAFL